jgi:hypothetical protein
LKNAGSNHLYSSEAGIPHATSLLFLDKLPDFIDHQECLHECLNHKECPATGATILL